VDFGRPARVSNPRLESRQASDHESRKNLADVKERSGGGSDSLHLPRVGPQNAICPGSHQSSEE